MNSGVKVNLGEIADLQVGYPFKSKDYSESPGAVKLVRGDNVVQGSFRWENVKKIEVKDVLPEVMQKYSLALHDVTLAMDRPWIAAGLKYSSVSEDDLPCLLVQRVCRLRAKDNLDQRFLKYIIGSAEFTAHIRNVETGTAVPHISQSSIAEFSFSLPPLEIQKMNQTLEEIAKAIFKSWFVDFDPVRAKAEGRPTGLPPEISDLFPDELVDSEIGEIPMGWNVLKVKDEAIRLKVGKLYSNKSVEHEGSIPVLDQSDAGIIGYHSNDEFVSASLENPVFTFANHTCKMRLLFSDFGVIQNVIPIQSKSYPTIWFYLRTLGIKQFEEYKGHIPDFMDTQLCFPSVQLAKSLNELVTPLFHRIEISNRENKVLAELRDTLLPKIISGELRIPDAEKFLEEAGI